MLAQKVVGKSIREMMPRPGSPDSVNIKFDTPVPQKILTMAVKK
jgi:hypothetical protein